MTLQERVLAGRAPRVFTVPPGAPFLDLLARAILAGGFPAPGTPAPDPVALVDYEVLVPTRRAARELAHRFLEVGGGSARLLPRIRPLGDIDEDELILGDGAAGGDALEVPPAIPALERQLLLARLVQEWANANQHAHLAQALISGPAQAFAVAGSLGMLIDSFETEEVGLEAIARLGGGDHPVHRQAVLDFLDLVRVRLPAELLARGLIGPHARRRRLIDAEATRLAQTDAGTPIIAAGSTGSIPATARLLAVIARLRQGAVVLPGLDLALDAASWDELDPQHPQSGLRRLLDTIGLRREAVAPLPGCAAAPGERARLISEAMRPSRTSDRWRGTVAALTPARLDAATQGLEMIEAPGPREEALAIALILRRTLEEPGRTAALITPDRSLARRVKAELARWQVEIDDSGGEPLPATPAGSFLMHVLDAVASGFAPVPLLALLKHPLARFGLERAVVGRRARQIEVAALRGLRPPKGIAGLKQALLRREEGENRRTRIVSNLVRGEWHGVERFLDRIARKLEPLIERMEETEPVALADLLKAHLEAAGRAASGAEGCALWLGEAGEALAAATAGLLDAAPEAPAVRPQDYAEALRGLLAGSVVRPRHVRHPRLRILGLLEARLLHADVMVLGGLNENVWPPGIEVDPWLNRPMREELALSPPERRTGLAAHDFAQAAAAPRVYLTWSKKIAGAPAVASRWVLRLQALLRAAGRSGAHAAGDPWIGWALGIDHACEVRPAEMPAPAPPLIARPRRLSVTRVEELIRDPYGAYARHILRLEPVEALAAAPGAADRGVLIHEALQRFAERHPGPLPTDPAAALIDIGKELFAPWREEPDVMGFWWPQFERIARWFAATEPRRRAGVAASLVETQARWSFDSPGGKFELTARADRIDVLDDGSARILDYKTGRIPSIKQEQAGFSPQLPLEAKLSMLGAFEGLSAREVCDLVYVRLTGGEPAGVETDHVNEDIAALAEQNFAGFLSVIAEYDRPEQPYIPRQRVEFEQEERDFDHLARFAEWASRRADQRS